MASGSSIESGWPASSLRDALRTAPSTRAVDRYTGVLYDALDAASLDASARRWLGAHGRPVSLEHYGASADFKTLYKEFGITPEATVAEARRLLG